MASNPNLIRDADEAIKIAGSAKTVAVLGIKTIAQASQAAYFVPEFLQSTGIEIIPVPIYYPEVKEILGKGVVRDLKEITRPVDVLDVFRRPQDLPQHLNDILAMNPRPTCVWLQSGISNPEFEMKLAEAGIKVVSNRCLKVDRTSAGYRARF
jgi:predicted CoA-binding protein